MCERAEQRVRVGIGYDIHAFDPARVLVLGGVKIEGAWGLKGRYLVGSRHQRAPDPTPSSKRCPGR